MLARWYFNQSRRAASLGLTQLAANYYAAALREVECD